MTPARGADTDNPRGDKAGVTSEERARAVRRGALFVAIGAGVIALDQWTKSWAQQSLGPVGHRHVIGPVNFLLTFNRGAAFSLGSGATPVIEAIAIALVVVVVAFSRRLALGGTSLAVIVGLGLLFGGAMSNLADRFFRHHSGAVVDFIQLVSWWPTFNVADAAVTCGAVIAAIALLFSSSERASGDRASGDRASGDRASGDRASGDRDSNRSRSQALEDASGPGEPGPGEFVSGSPRRGGG
jgi:signal peptidase II